MSCNSRSTNDTVGHASASSALRLLVAFDHGYEIFSSGETYARQRKVTKIVINGWGTLYK